MTNTVTDNSGDRRYFSMIPHLIDDSELDPYAYRLYGHLKRIAGAQHRCERSTRQLAKHCRMSVGKVHNAKIELAKAGFIKVHGEGRTDKIELIDIWRNNVLAYAPDDRSQDERSQHERSHGEQSGTEGSGDERSSGDRSHGEQDRSGHEQYRSSGERSGANRSPDERERSHGEHTEEYIEDLEPTEKPGEKKGDHRPAADAPPDPESREQLARALCWVCYGHQEIEALSERDGSALRAETRRIADSGFSQDDLRIWFRDHWQADWRWQNGRGRPEPAEVRSWIPAVRDDSDIDQEMRLAEWRELGLMHNGEGSRDPAPPPPQETGPQVHGDVWQEVVDELADQLVPETLAWFDGSRLEDLGPMGGDAGGSRVYRIVLARPDGLSWIRNRGGPLLRRTISRTLGEQALIEVELAEGQPAEQETAGT